MSLPSADNSSYFEDSSEATSGTFHLHNEWVDSNKTAIAGRSGDLRRQLALDIAILDHTPAPYSPSDIKIQDLTLSPTMQDSTSRPGGEWLGHGLLSPMGERDYSTSPQTESSAWISPLNSHSYYPSTRQYKPHSPDTPMTDDSLLTPLSFGMVPTVSTKTEPYQSMRLGCGGGSPSATYSDIGTTINLMDGRTECYQYSELGQSWTHFSDNVPFSDNPYVFENSQDQLPSVDQGTSLETGWEEPNPHSDFPGFLGMGAKASVTAENSPEAMRKSLIGQYRTFCDETKILKMFGKAAKKKVSTFNGIRASYQRRKNPAKFICHIQDCGQSFTRKHNLENHLKSHCGITDLQCRFCGKGFTTIPVWKRHQETCQSKTQNNEARLGMS